MKKKLLLIGCGCLLFASCKPETDVNNNYCIDENNNLTINYYQKDVKNSLVSFIEQGEPSQTRSLNESDMSETDCLAMLWQELSEEQKQLVKENINEVQITKDLYLELDSNTSASRALRTGDSSEVEKIKRVYALEERVKDAYSCYQVPIEMAKINNTNGINQDINADVVILKLGKENDWEGLQEVLSYINMKEDYNNLKTEFSELYLYENNTSRSLSRSSGDKYKENALMDDVGKRLKDGEVIITNSSSKAFILGDWMHAGIFSAEKYNSLGKNDGVHCVYTAQPDEYDSFPEDMKPDNPGYTCMDTIFMYTRQHKFCTLLPKAWSKDKAEKAVLYAKEKFYDNKAEYNLPWWEMLIPALNTSHDLTSSNVYCSKVAYSAWASQGVNLDSNTFAGNLVSPDDLHDSTISRYGSFTICIPFFSYTWTWTIYEAQANLNLYKCE